MKRFICIVILLLSTFILSLTLSADVVHIPDPNLRATVAEALNIPTGDPIPYTKMRRLRELNARGRQIQNLTGLEQATHLRKLHLGGNLISDISPLGMLTNLESLNLRDNLISDISPLANLTKLTYLKLRNNQVSELAPLSNLVRLDYLNLNKNRVTDVSPLAQLTRLEWLSLVNNRITDHSPLDDLLLQHFYYDQVCDMPPLPLQPRLENRTFPSFYSSWGATADNQDHLSYIEKLSQYDLYFSSSLLGVSHRFVNGGWEMAGALDEGLSNRDELIAHNPNIIFLKPLDGVWTRLQNLPEDSPFWLRDAQGEIMHPFSSGVRGLLNWNHPGVQAQIIEQAVAVAKCGLYDGIIFDGWREYYTRRRGLLQGMESILSGIRDRVRPDFLIVVNSNRSKTPVSMPYINGIRFDPTVLHSINRGGAPNNEEIEEKLTDVENTLAWAEKNLRQPQVNLLRIEGIDSKPFDSPANLRWMRATTTLGLTFSDGYVLYTFSGSQQHAWYDFWNADLGRPVGEKSTLYDAEITGLYIREYTNGWAVYNHSGDAQIVTLPEEARSAANGWQNTKHAVLDLDGDIFLRIPPKLPGDLNGDGVINILDLSMVAQAIGTDKREADVNGDGVVNVLDLVFVADQF